MNYHDHFPGFDERDGSRDIFDRADGAHERITETEDDPMIKEMNDIEKINESITLACSAFGVKKDRIFSKSRKRYECVYPRFFAMYFGHIVYGVKLNTMGVFVGMKSHATVIHAVKVVTNFIHGKIKDDEMFLYYAEMRRRTAAMSPDEIDRRSLAVYEHYLELEKINNFLKQANGKEKRKCTS